MLKTIFHNQINNSKNTIWFVLLSLIFLILILCFKNIFLQSSFIFLFIISYIISFIKIFHSSLVSIFLGTLFVMPMAAGIEGNIEDKTSLVFILSCSFLYLFYIPLLIKTIYYLFGYDQIRKKTEKALSNRPSKKNNVKLDIFLIAIVNFLSLIPSIIMLKEYCGDLPWANRHLVFIIWSIYAAISIPVIRTLNKKKELSAFKITLSYPVWILPILGNILPSIFLNETGATAIACNFPLEYIYAAFLICLSVFNTYTYYKAKPK